MICIALALLVAGPVHKKAIRPMDHQDSHYHITEDPKGSNAPQESNQKAQPTEELGSDGHHCERSRNAHLLGEETHSTSETIAAEPTQHLFRHVSGKPA